MQKRRVITVVIGAALCLGAIAAAQDLPGVLARADEVVREQPGRTTFTGNVHLTVDGVMVRADRAVIRDGVALEGNVRLTLPKGARVSTVKMMPALTPLPPSKQP